MAMLPVHYDLESCLVACLFYHSTWLFICKCAIENGFSSMLEVTVSGFRIGSAMQTFR